MDSEPTLQLSHHTRRKPLLLVVAIIVLLALVTLITVIVASHGEKQAPPPPKQQTATAAPKVRLVLFAAGLPNPTGIVATGQSGDTRLFVLDQSGIVRIVKQDGTVLPTPFLDISSGVTFSGEMGLLGMAFSPKYAQDGNFFVDYIDKNQNTVIARYHVSKDANKANATSAQTVLTLKQPYPNHNGGDLVFGPDGYLYVATGDGGSEGDPENRAQDLSSLFGKLLRLDVSSLPYKAPAGNPFVTKAGAAHEIWDYGLRNPWRISFDRQTNDLYIADVGQSNYEELDFEPAGNDGGNNYGWRCLEGYTNYNLTGCQPGGQYVSPVLVYDHSDKRCSITGGYVYRGRAYPALEGKYFYADYCNGDVYWTQKGGTKWQSTLASKTAYKITTFGEDNSGELYLADANGSSLYRVEDAADAAK